MYTVQKHNVNIVPTILLSPKPVQIFALVQVKAHLIFFSAFLPACSCSGYFNVTHVVFIDVWLPSLIASQRWQNPQVLECNCGIKNNWNDWISVLINENIYIWVNISIFEEMKWCFSFIFLLFSLIQLYILRIRMHHWRHPRYVEGWEE